MGVNGQSEIKISIIMPVYNAEQFLKDSIGDIISQSFEDFELICVEDGSTDKSGVMLDEFAKRDERVTVIHQKNQGGGSARNNGMQYAIGKYLLFLDADDRFDKDLLKLAVEKAEETKSEIVVYDADTFDNKSGERKSAPWLIKKKEFRDEDDVFAVFNMTVWNKMFLREFIEEREFKFTERKAGYSTSFVALSLLYADKISMLNKVLLHYRTNNPNSNIANEDKDPTAIYDALLEVKKRLIEDGVLRYKREAFLRLCEESIIARFNAMRTADGYLQLYNTLHNDGLKALLFDGGIINDEDITDYIRTIMDKSAAEFLYNQRKEKTVHGITGIESFILPQFYEKPEIKKVVLYGGGDVGINFFNQIKRKGKYNLVGWVDRNYEKIGWPLQSPDVLKELDYDGILIAVVDEKIADSIKKAIIGMGISEYKILWKPPIRI